MTKLKFVEHTGYVESFNSDQVKVRILSESACASCHAKGACTASDMKEKVIDVSTYGVDHLAVGQQVVIRGQKSLGLKASLIAYIFPFILVFITLFVVHGITKSEGIAGIASLAVLVPYFIGVKLYTPKLEKTFVFTIKEIIG
ncbi:SoxR reducing system RseC family protein [Saccharicrinis fermentans]|uniref:Positive regulator of sigma E activity n=1 Tax=Saccharicrinis fermentans DSM 9555 = JCM 21142 TaxID=869213 RepID=W7YJN2_9BACT|nr:SoxR reducing system RseC family protein [Saccharicrinis fermentans]GAF04741.1 positive regulator of sigma E activity [Saccharicrinis fermentans DSM 9555 = JCM 21142]